MNIHFGWIVLLLAYSTSCVRVIRKSNDSDEILIQDMDDCKKFKNTTQTSRGCVCSRKDAIFHKMNGTLGCFSQDELGGNMPTENMKPTIYLTEDSIYIMDDSFQTCSNGSEGTTRLCRWKNGTWVQQQKTVIIERTSSKFEYSIPETYHGILYRIDVFCSDHHTLTLFIGLPGETEYPEDMIKPPGTKMDDDKSWLKQYAVKVAIALLAGILFLFASGACIIIVRRKGFKVKLEVSKTEVPEKEKDPVTSQVKDNPVEPEYEYIPVVRQSLPSPTADTYQGIDPDDIDFISTLYHMLKNDTLQKQLSITKDPSIAHEYENEDYHSDTPPHKEATSDDIVDCGSDLKLKLDKTRYENLIANYKSMKSTGIPRDESQNSIKSTSKTDIDSVPSNDTNNDTDVVISTDLNKVDDNLVFESKEPPTFRDAVCLKIEICESDEISECDPHISHSTEAEYHTKKAETCV